MIIYNLLEGITCFFRLVPDIKKIVKEIKLMYEADNNFMGSVVSVADTRYRKKRRAIMAAAYKTRHPPTLLFLHTATSPTSMTSHTQRPFSIIPYRISGRSGRVSYFHAHAILHYTIHFGHSNYLPAHMSLEIAKQPLSYIAFHAFLLLITQI